MLNEVKSTSGGENQNSSMNNELRSKNKLVWWLIGLIVLAGVGYGGYLLGQNQKSNLKSQNDNSKLNSVETPTTPAQTPPSSPTPQSTTFNLIYKYGVGAKNELNTFSQTYTKDMVQDPSVTTKLKLTDIELADIHQKLNDLKLFDESTNPVEGNAIVTPCSSYYLKVQINSEQKELYWDDCKGRISDKFQQFSNYIIQIIESKEEYKKLPTSQGGYL